MQAFSEIVGKAVVAAQPGLFSVKKKAFASIIQVCEKVQGVMNKSII